MLHRLLDMALGMIARIFFGLKPENELSFEDLMERLGHSGERLLARLQKILLGLAAVLVTGLLAMIVLTLRIYEISAGRTVAVLGFPIDGAILFGLALALLAAAIAYAIFRSGRQPAEHAPRVERVAERPPPTVSPLEEALAAWLMHRLHEKEEKQRSQSTSEPSNDWQKPPHMSSRNPENADERFPEA